MILQATVVRLVWLALVSLLAGLLGGLAWALGIALAGCLGLLVGHLRNLRMLWTWLRDPVGQPLPAGTGSWEHVFSALSRDVKLRRIEREQLEGALEQFRRAGEAMPDAVVMLDDAHHVEWCNSRAQGHFGLESARDYGAPILNFIRQPEFVRYLDSGKYDRSEEHTSELQSH